LPGKILVLSAGFAEIPESTQPVENANVAICCTVSFPASPKFLDRFSDPVADFPRLL